MYTAEYEDLVSIVRLFAPGRTTEDEYCWSCVIKRIDNVTCEICNVTRGPTHDERRALRSILNDKGYTTFRWVRYKGIGDHRWKEFTRKMQE